MMEVVDVDDKEEEIMKNKKYLVGEGTAIWYNPETGKEFKCKTIPTDTYEDRRGYGRIKNADKTQTNEKEKN